MAKSKDKISVEVIQSFRDRDNFKKIYSVGEIISGFDKERVQKLIELKLVKSNDQP